MSVTQPKVTIDQTSSRKRPRSTVDDDDDQDYLPQFPQPTHPAPPTKSTLSLQGFDQSFLQAEIIDPAQLSPINANEWPNGQPNLLSKQIKTRLGDLGITEFFAGKPFLWLGNHLDLRPEVSTNGFASLLASRTRRAESVVLPL